MTFDFSTSTVIDISALILALFYVIRGFRRGFIKELFSFLGLVVGFVLIWKYAPSLAGMLKFKLGLNDIIAYIIAIVVIFVIVNIAASYLGVLLGRFFYLVNLSVADKLMGAFCGFIKASVIFILFYLACQFAASYLGNDEIAWMDQSKALALANNMWNYISGWLLNTGIIKHITFPNLTIKVQV